MVEVIYERECSGGVCGDWYITDVIYLYSFCTPTGTSGGGSGGVINNPTGGTTIQASGPVPRTANATFTVINKFLCPLQGNVNLHINFTPSQESGMAGIVQESNGSFLMTTGAITDAVTRSTLDVNGNVNIWLSQNAYDHGELFLAAIIGHELVHARHVNQSGSVSNSPASEYAAYSWMVDFLERHSTLVKLDPFLKGAKNFYSSELASLSGSNAGLSASPCTD